MNLRDRARRLRSRQTDAEQRLWYHLRAHRCMGLKFKRQKPLGRFIVDFICHEHGLIVEVDGGQHATQKGYDKARDVWLRKQGYRVLRFWNHEVMQQLDAVLDQIRLAVGPSPLTPLPRTGEGKKENPPVGSSPALPAGRASPPDPLPFAGEGRKENATDYSSPLPLAGEGRKENTADHASPLPRTGEGPGERVFRSTEQSEDR